MVTKKDLKEFEFKNLERFFEYIIESIINGQRRQAQNLVSVMSQRQKNQFVNWLETTGDEIFHSDYTSEAKRMALTC